MSWSGGTGEAIVGRITLDGDSLNWDTCWTGQIFEMPDLITFIDIKWHETGDRIVLTGTVGTYDYDGIAALLGPDPSVGIDSIVRSMTYRVIVLDTPQTLRLLSGDKAAGEHYLSMEALMICIDYADGMDRYEGRHITFSIDPANTLWPTSADTPLGQPHTEDVHILD